MTKFTEAIAKAREAGSHAAVTKRVPDAEGWWLWLDGSPHGCAVFVHDPTGDGLQFDSGAVSSETNLAAYAWRGRLVVASAQAIDAIHDFAKTTPFETDDFARAHDALAAETFGNRVASDGTPIGPGLWAFGKDAVRVVREEDGSLAFDVATETERLAVGEYRDSPWGGRLVVEGPKVNDFEGEGLAREDAKLFDLIDRGTDILLEGLAAKVDAMREALLERGHTDECYSGELVGCDCPLAVLWKVPASTDKTMPAGATIQGGEHDVEGGRFSPSDFDCVEYLNTTPAGACRRVTETSGGESLTFEDDRRLPVASEDGASELAKLEALVAKMVDGNFGAGNFNIGGLEVIVADRRYMTAASGGINVSTSQAPRTGGE